MALVCNSLKISNVKHIFICLLATCMFSFKNVILELLSIFNGVGCFVVVIELYEQRAES